MMVKKGSGNKNWSRYPPNRREAINKSKHMRFKSATKGERNQHRKEMWDAGL